MAKLRKSKKSLTSQNLTPSVPRISRKTILPAAAGLFISVGFAAYAANTVFHGNVSITEHRTSSQSPSSTADNAAKSTGASACGIRPLSNSSLVENYGDAAKSPLVAAAIRQIEAKAPSKGAVEASDKFEAMLQRGEPLLGTEAPWLSQQQEFANLLPFKQEGSVAVPMPNFPRIPGPHMPVLPRMGPLTPEEIDQMAGMPPDPQDAVLLSQGISRAQVNAANQALIEQHLREEHGPVYVPPLHVDHDWLAKHATKTANGFVVTKDFDGSIREMTDSSGNIVAEYSYDPWGVPTKISGSGPTPDFLFQGMFYHQPSGKYLTVFRAYDPSIGRWISREPLGEDAGTNLYTFVGNNPLSYRDPLGLYFVYWGSPNGRAAAESQVNDLGNQPGTGPLVQDLQSSPVPVIIAAEYNQSVFGNSTSPITSPIFSGESAGSIIRYNPFMQPSDNDALSHFKGCPARNSLAHELGHAWNLAHGIDEPHTRPPLFAVPPEGMTPGFERFPMIMEGADRLNLGLPSRGPYIESGGPFYAPGYSHGRF